MRDVANRGHVSAKQGNDGSRNVLRKAACCQSHRPFVGEAKQCDIRLHGKPACMISEARRNRKKAGVTIRFAFDATINGGA
jgi:hypothetical protein